jgi:hypothetical protein
MSNKVIQSFDYSRLSNAGLVTVLESLFEHALTPARVQAAQLVTKPFTDFKTATDKYLEIFRRNPALLYTREYEEVIRRLRNLMSLFSARLKSAAQISTGDALANVEVVMHSSTQYLKNLHAMPGADLLGNAHELVSELGKLDLANRVATLELTSQLALIAQFQQEGIQYQGMRGDERELKKALGTATKQRLVVEKALIVLFQIVIPAVYLMGTPDTAPYNTLKEVIFKINSVLDDYRHLVSGNTGDDDIVPPEDEIPELPDDPQGGGDTGGGSGEDTGGGSGGPLD